MDSVVALHRNHYGEIINFITSTGRIISYRKALMEVQNGEITGLQAIANSDGSLILSPEQGQSFDHLPNLF